MPRKKTVGRGIAQQAERLGSQLRSLSIVTQAEEFGERAARGIARQVNHLLDPLPVATKREVARIDRQVSQLTRRLRELEKDGNTTPHVRSTRSRNPGQLHGRERK